MNIKPKKGVIYYRVSTEDQAQFGVSLEQQKKHCQSYATANGIEVLRFFHDDGVSAKTADRAGLKELLEFCTQKGNTVDCVIVYKIDRLTRNVNDYSNILFLLNKLGVSLISTTEAIDSTPIGKFMGNFLAANAQLDNDIKSQRVAACMREAVEQGRWCWKAKFGYSNGRDELNRKTIILDEKRAPLIRFAFERYATGLYTLEEVRAMINEKGLRSWEGQEISSQLMNKIITCKFYIGIMTVKGEEFPNAKHDKIIDAATFYKCQAQLRRNSKGDKLSRSRSLAAFSLKNFALCGLCKRPMTAYFSKGKMGVMYPYYRCYNKKCTSKRSVSREKVEGDFFHLLKDVTPDHEYADQFKKVILSVWESEYRLLNLEHDEQLKKIESLKQEKEKLIEMKKKELLPDDDFKEAFAKVRHDIQEREASLVETPLENFNAEEAIDHVFGYLKTLSASWKDAPYEHRLKLQGLICLEKPIYDYTRFYTPKLSPILATKKELATANSSFVDFSSEYWNSFEIELEKIISLSKEMMPIPDSF